MILYIAEKPSLARAIADVLPKPHKKENGFIRVGNGDCVSWCVGHLLEHVEPDAYDSKYKQWRLEHLPIFPEKWKLKPKSKTKSQLSILKKLVAEADQLIHAGDPDREGQLLVDQVIAYQRVPKRKINTLKRCLISDLNPSAVKRAINQLRDNKDFAPLSTSALARTRADWLFGINLTRAYTVQGRKVGYDGVLSVGRVQTPILGIVVRRDQEIESFVSNPFSDVRAHLQTLSLRSPSKHSADSQADSPANSPANGAEGDKASTFFAKWIPSEACQPYMDSEGRVLVKKLAENVVNRITNQSATVTKVEEKLKKQAPPLPYNLSSLQIDAARRYGMSAKQVLDHCQTLYERYKLITYPRSDSRYLPLEHFKRANKVISAVSHNSKKLLSAANEANECLKSLAWNDKKVEAHHAIIPTEKQTNLSSLSAQEMKIYELIARQYLYQFYPIHEYFDTRLEVNIEGGLFSANDKRVKIAGWKVLSGSSLASDNTVKLETSLATSHNNDASSSQGTLPALKKGDKLHCTQGELLEKATQPPKHFTDASLLAAMTGISRFVKDPSVKKILRETDGLGTEATRANIIELLFKRGYLKRDKKTILATPTGKGLIESLPEKVTMPDMTAEWEAKLNAICSRESSYDTFMEPLTLSIQSLVEQSKVTLPTALSGVKSVKPMFRKKRRIKA